MADLLLKQVFKSFKLETAISITKSMLLSVGFISTITLFKVAVIPKIANLYLVIKTLPRFWLSPPYVFIIFNFIIVAIAASSSIFRHQKEPSHTYSHDHNSSQILIEDEKDEPGGEEEEEEDEGEGEEEEEPLKWDSLTGNVGDPLPENLCAYSSGEKVEEKDEDAGDSMEATWQSIMERQGKQKPQLKKSETWDSPPRLIRARAGAGDGDGADADDKEDPVTWARNEVRKSNMFKETLSFRRKKSMGQEELKRRAEAFIEMVNRSIRLQRQESEQRFRQTVQRSV